VGVGTCSGRLLTEPRGTGGFGYDPLLIPEGHSQTLAELDESVKNGISHRARAIAELRPALRAYLAFRARH
jgi:XTP/dITP diphosphohydrolase